MTFQSGLPEDDDSHPRYEGSFDDDEVLAEDVAAQQAQAASEAALQQPEEVAFSSGAVRLSTKVEYTSLARASAHTVFGLVSVEATTPPEEPAALAPAETAASSAPLTTALSSWFGGAATALTSVPAAATAARRSPVDLVCVLDVSGSMSGSKVQLLKDAMGFVVSELGDGDRLSITSFNCTAHRRCPLLRMHAEGKEAARRAVSLLNAGGGTCIRSGMDCGLRTLEQRRQRNPVSAVFLLTDGIDPGARNHAESLARRCRSAAGASLHCFGFGADHDAGLLSNLAEAAQTSFTFVEQPTAIREAFAGAIGGLMSTAAQKVQVSIECLGGARLLKAHTSFRTGALPQGGEGTCVRIPDLFAGERKDLLLELKVPELPEGDAVETTELLRASVRYFDVAETATVQTPWVLLELQRRPAEEQPEVEPDEEVSDQRQRVEVTNALKDSIWECEQGNFEKAQELIAGSKRRLKEEVGRRTSRGWCKSTMAEALAVELDDAEVRVSSFSAFHAGGHAEMSDALCTHSFQRSTTSAVNASVSFEMRATKSRSKSMYATSSQRACMEKSMAY